MQGVVTPGSAVRGRGSDTWRLGWTPRAGLRTRPMTQQRGIVDDERQRGENVRLTIGTVGLPNVGKSTLFNALTKNDVLAANYPFATIEPNVGVVGVPDPRLG